MLAQGNGCRASGSHPLDRSCFSDRLPAKLSLRVSPSGPRQSFVTHLSVFIFAFEARLDRLPCHPRLKGQILGTETNTMTSRQLTLFALACFVLAIPLSHSAISKKKAAKKNGLAPKVALCHFSDDEDSDAGHVINVSANAVPAHLEKHGDCTQFAEGDDGACRCLTCEELCEAANQQCVAGCGPQDQECLATCQLELDQCIIDCGPPTDPG
jgi:hypothetical protein